MSQRFSSPERRTQIIQAALELLGRVPVERLTTRQVAKAVGVSQPALFRHFTNREAILEGVVQFVQASLERSAQQVLARDLEVRATLVLLLDAFFDFIRAHPGAPRMLFYDAASMGEGSSALRASLPQIVARQTTLVSVLVRAEIDRGALAKELDAQRSGELLVALLQGQVLRWHLHGQGPGDLASAQGLVDFWWGALASGQPVRSGAEAQSTAPSATLLMLDARPLLKAGSDPFDAVNAALDDLTPAGTLVLVAPFKPAPLIAVLGKRGFGVTCEGQDPGPFTLLIAGREAPEPLDLRDLPTPEPLEAVLLASAELAPGENLLARLPREPKLLFPRLQERGLSWTCVQDGNGQALLHLQRIFP